MDRNMCLQELEVRCVGSVQDDDSADDDPHWEVDLGAPIVAAISRNRQAFAAAQALGQVLIFHRRHAFGFTALSAAYA